jgi:adenosylcobyric acid synthase
MGVSSGAALERPAFIIEGRGEGAHSADGQVLGSYLHGMFDTPQAFSALLAWAGLDGVETVDLDALREASLERLADAARPLYEALKKLESRFGQ